MTAVRLAISDLVRTFKNSKTWVIMFLCFFFFLQSVLTMRELAEQFQIGITPYVYPIFMSSWNEKMYALVLIVLIMGEAPFYSGAEVFINMRISRYKWFAGKLIYIGLLSVIFQLIMIAVSILVCAPYLGISDDWGDIIRTYMKTMTGANSETGILSMKPMTCMIYEFILMILMSIIIALIIFLINGVMKNISGTILVGAVIMMDEYLSDLKDFYLLDMEYVLPTAWIDISVFCEQTNMTIEKCMLNMTIIIAVLVITCLVLVGKRVIRPVKNV